MRSYTAAANSRSMPSGAAPNALYQACSASRSLSLASVIAAAYSSRSACVTSGAFLGSAIVILSGRQANRSASEAQSIRPAVARLVLLQPQQRLVISLTLDQREVFGSSPQFNSRVRAWQGRSDARQVSTATPSLGDGLACGAHRSQAMRPVDTLPGGLGSLKSF